MALSPGVRLGPYVITAQIGVGGMGEVYRATDTNLKRAVAIKVLPESLATDVERLARFQREAEVLASLNHPNVAAIYGLERSGGIAALVMELVEGGPTLADRIAGAPGGSEGPPLRTEGRRGGSSDPGPPRGGARLPAMRYPTRWRRCLPENRTGRSFRPACPSCSARICAGACRKISGNAFTTSPTCGWRWRGRSRPRPETPGLSGQTRPTTGTEGAAGPFWSPDSRSVGFFAEGKLKRLDIGGGAPQTLAGVNATRGGTWNADGVILFQSSTEGPLFRVPASGGEAVAVTKLDRQVTHRLPSFLPDGRFLINTVLDAAAAPITLLQNWTPQP